MKPPSVGSDLSLGLIAVAPAVALSPARTAVMPAKHTSGGAQFAVDGGSLRVQFSGMSKQGPFNVIRISENRGALLPISEEPDAVLHCTGKEVKIN